MYYQMSRYWVQSIHDRLMLSRRLTSPQNLDDFYLQLQSHIVDAYNPTITYQIDVPRVTLNVQMEWTAER